MRRTSLSCSLLVNERVGDLVLRTIVLLRVLASASLTSIDLLLQANGGEVAVELFLLLGLRLSLELLLVDDRLLGLLVGFLNA